MIYNELVESYFFAPQHVGMIEDMTPLSIHYRSKEANFSDVIDLYLEADKEGDIIKARFKAFGSPYVIASAEWLCRQLENSSLQKHPCFNYLAIMEALAIPKTNMAAALQLDEAYKAAIDLLKTKLERKDYVRGCYT